MATTPKNIDGASMATALKRAKYMIQKRNEYLQSGEVDNLHVFISNGNSKTNIPDVSLIPLAYCCNCSFCGRLCYDIRHDTIPGYHESVCIHRSRNSAILHKDMHRYFAEINEFLTVKKPSAFRFHVGGDIKNYDYFIQVIQTAKTHKNTTFLIFTKAFSIVNRYLNEGHKIPKNLRVIFSYWKGQPIDNPHNLPFSSPIFVGDPTPKYNNTTVRFCGENCASCHNEKKGCFALKKGQGVYFNAH